MNPTVAVFGILRFSLHAVQVKGIPVGYAEKQILRMLG